MTARHRLADVPGAQEDGEAGHRMTQEGRRDPAGQGGQPAADDPDPERQRQQISVSPGRAEAGRQRIDDRLEQVGQERVNAAAQEQPEQRAAKGDLVDERGGRRVEQGPGVRALRRQADPVVAVARESGRDQCAEAAERDPAEDRAEPVARSEEELGAGRRVDRQDQQGDPEAQAVPGQPTAQPGPLASPVDS